MLRPGTGRCGTEGQGQEIKELHGEINSISITETALCTSQACWLQSSFELISHIQLPHGANSIFIYTPSLHMYATNLSLLITNTINFTIQEQDKTIASVMSVYLILLNIWSMLFKQK